MTTEQIQQELEEVNGAFITLLINDQTPLQIRSEFDMLSDRKDFLHRLLRENVTKAALDSFAAKQLKAEGCLVGGVICLAACLIITVINIWL